MTNPNPDPIYPGHFMHRWSKWKSLTLRIMIKRGDDPETLESMESYRYRVCERCGLEQRAK